MSERYDITEEELETLIASVDPIERVIENEIRRSVARRLEDRLIKFIYDDQGYIFLPPPTNTMSWIRKVADEVAQDFVASLEDGVGKKARRRC